MDSIKIVFLLFIIYSFMGWVMEVIVTWPETKCFVNRGFLIGPICPIYGFGALSMIFLLFRFHDPFLLFVTSLIVCSILEYVTSYAMEKLFNARWWDYSHLKFNLNGRICLQNSIGFGLLGVALAYYINPFMLGVLLNINPTILTIAFYIILVLFVIDNILSFKVIIKIKDMSLKYVNLDNTKELKNKIMKLLSDKILHRRLFQAFPNMKLIITSKMKQVKDKIKVLK